MGEQFLLALSENLHKLGGSLSGWLGQHALNIAIILVGAWIMRHFGERLFNQVLKATVREDLYPNHIEREKRLKTLRSLAGAFIRITIYIVAVVMIISEIGINTGPLLASAGILGVALGFGAQSLVKDFVSGIFIIVENQYRVGDVVKLGDVTGVVDSLTVRTTVLRDLSGHVHHIPNGTIAVTTNKTMDYGRINEDIAVNFDTDLDKLKHVIDHVGEEIAALPELKHTIHEPPQMVSVNGFSQNGVVVKILARVNPSDEWRVRSEMYKRLQKALAKNEIGLAGSQPAAATPTKRR